MEIPSKLSARNQLLYWRFTKALAHFEAAMEQREAQHFNRDHGDYTYTDHEFSKAERAVDAARAALIREVIALSQSEPATAA